MLHTLTSPEALADFAHQLLAFMRQSGLEDILPLNLDHLAIKLANSAEYEVTLAEASTLCSSPIEYIDLNGRRIAIAHFDQPFQLPGIGSLHLLEIMEPRPDNQTGFKGIDHLEVFVDNYNLLKEHLADLGIAFQIQDNGHHQTLTLTINPSGQEIKFSNIPIQKTLEVQRKNGLLRLA